MLNSENTLLLVVDIQEKLTGMLKENKETAEQNAKKIVKAAKILKIKTVVSEQYPKGLGSTVEAVRNEFPQDVKIFEKTQFSLASEKEILDEILKSGKKQIVIFGIEAHICVFQTALELKEKGYEVFVVSDISYSRNNEERLLALKNLRHFGIMTPSLETVLFMWLRGSKNPNFKEIQSLIK